MQYFIFNNIQIPLSCVTGFSYTKAGNIVPTSRLSYRCKGINPIQVQVQLTINSATCFNVDNVVTNESNFMDLARNLSQIRPSKADVPSYITVGEHIIIPQMKFMLISTNITYQSDRLGNLQEIQISWTLGGSRVVKDENRNLELKSNADNSMPKVRLYCKGKSVECSQDISISELRLSGFKGTIEVLLADTYTDAARDAWLYDVIESDDAYFEIEDYGKWYIEEGYFVVDNWLSFDLTKFSKPWYQKCTETLISTDSTFTLKDVFKDAEVKSKAKFEYLKYDDMPINMLRNLQDSLGYLIGLRDDKIYLYDAPDKIVPGSVTYDFPLDNDLMTRTISKVIIRDGKNEFTAGDDKGETFFVDAVCRVTSESAENVLKYANFNRNMLTLTIPLERRINIGSIINVNVGDTVINCVCTEYDADFMTNQMQIELHYVDR